jgi:hypothetical protein
MAFLQYKTGAIKEKNNPRGDERTAIVSVFVKTRDYQLRYVLFIFDFS